jgi:hypothetical protein
MAVVRGGEMTYKIETIKQLVSTYKNLNNDKSRCTFLKDLTMFLMMFKELPENEFVKIRPIFHWKDDGITGVSSINITKQDVK